MILDIVVVVIVVVDVVVETVVVGVKVVFEHCCNGEFHINMFFLNIVKTCL